MSTKLTTPIPQLDITHQAVTRVGFVVAHKLTPLGDDIVFDKDNIRVIYEVTTFDSDLKIVEKVNEISDWNSLPSVFKSELKSVYDRLVTDAHSKALIGSGTDEVLS